MTQEQEQEQAPKPMAFTSAQFQYNHGLHEFLLAAEDSYNQNPITTEIDEGPHEHYITEVPFSHIAPYLVQSYLQGQHSPSTSLELATVLVSREGDDQAGYTKEYHVSVPGNIEPIGPMSVAAANEMATQYNVDKSLCGACEPFYALMRAVERV